MVKTYIIANSVQESVFIKDILDDSVSECLNVSSSSELQGRLVENESVVLIFFLNSVADAEENYLKLYRTTRISSIPHKTILLCSHEEIENAYQQCVKNIFNDYVVSKPDLDMFNLKLRRMQAINLLAIEEKTKVSTELSFNVLNGLAEQEENTKKLVESSEVLSRHLADEHDALNRQIQSKIASLPPAIKKSIASDTNNYINSEITKSKEKISKHINQSKKIYFNEYQRLHAEAEIAKNKLASASAIGTKNDIEKNIDFDKKSQSFNSQRRVLLIDEDQEGTSFAGKVLKNNNYLVNLVNHVNTSKAAISNIVKQRPDLIFYRYNLHGMPGGDFVRMANIMIDGDLPPVIFITDVSDMRSVKYMREIGASEIITIPFDGITLIQKVESVIS